MTENLMDAEIEKLLKPEAYKGSAEKTFDYYLKKKDKITKSRFKLALNAASVKKYGGLSASPSKLSKQEVLKIANSL